MMNTGILGGVTTLTGEELQAMQKGQYILHARRGKLTKVSAEKSLLPDSPPSDMVEIRTALAPDGAIYFNGNTSICKSTDEGRTWTSYERGCGPDGESISGSFQILSDGTFVCVLKASGGKRSDPVPIWASSDEGRTWQKISRVELPSQYFERYIYGFFRLPDDTLLCGISVRNMLADEHWTKWVSGKCTLLAYRSTDKGKSWQGPSAICDWGFEGGIVPMASGRLLAVIRYQRPLLPTDPPDLMEKTGGTGFPYKHIFLADSLDEGRNWKNFRQLTTVFGQCYGYPAALSDGTVVVIHDCRYGPYPSSARAMISYDEGKTWEDEAYYVARTQGMQSVVLPDDVILTTVETGGHLTAIRWKPVKAG